MEWNRKKVSVGNALRLKIFFGSESDFIDLNLELLTFVCGIFFLCERNSNFFKST